MFEKPAGRLSLGVGARVKLRPQLLIGFLELGALFTKRKAYSCTNFCPLLLITNIYTHILATIEPSELEFAILFTH